MDCKVVGSSGSNTRKVLGETTNQSTAPRNIPGPYVKGMVLDLSVNWTRGTPSEERVLFTVTKAFEVTVSPVVEVQWVSSSGQTQTAILKLFDRRYGRVRAGTRPFAHTPSVEDCWQRYVQCGQASLFFKHVECLNRDLGEGMWHIDPLEGEEDTADTWKMTAKKEGFLQYRALQSWRSEIRAYEHLEKLQGKCVPHFYGTTSFSLAPQGSDPETLRVCGILIQHIDGFTLDTLLEIKEPSPDMDYQGLYQRVVDVAEDINKHGVINDDCVTHNMIIQTGSMQPFEFDFSRCMFREDFASEDEYNEWARSIGNSCGFGGVVAVSLNRRFKLGIRHKFVE